MNITIKTIPKSEMRFDDVGDWWFDINEDLQIRVADMGNWKYEFLVADHEMHEALLCFDRGITTKQVDDFDDQFEKENGVFEVRKDKKLNAGDDINCPYKKEHFFATNLERLTSAELKIDWKTYNDFLESV